MLLFALKSKVINLFLSEIHRSFKQLYLHLKANYLFQGFLWLFWKRKNSYSLRMLLIFLQRQSWCFLLTWKCCNTHSSVVLCQTHGLNQHIHLHTVLPTGKYPTVTGFSYYTEPFQWFKPSSLVPFIFLPNFVLMKISFPLKWVLQKRQALC